MDLTIGICDDDPAQLSILRNYLTFFFVGSHTLQLIEADDPATFLDICGSSNPELVFLDIDMAGINGIELGNTLKSIRPETVVVYVTAHEKYATEAFQVRAFHYLLKPLTREKFAEVMDEAITYILSRAAKSPERSFSVQIKGEFLRLPYSDIDYFEKIGHRIKIHTATRDIYFYDKLPNLMERLDISVFLQCHQGFIANIDKIRSFREKTLYLERDIGLPVSRSHAEAVRDRLAKMLFARKERG